MTDFKFYLLLLDNNFEMVSVQFLAVIFAACTLANANPASNVKQVTEKRVVCYYGSWAVYRHSFGFYDVESIDPHICTHLIYGFAGLSSQGTIIALDDYNDHEDNWRKGAFRRFTNLKKQNPKLKTLLAIGGWNEGSEKYSRMVSTAQGRQVFLESVIPLLKHYDFDGLDLDWEYPAACTINCGQPIDKENFVSLCQEMRVEFDKHGWLLTAAVSAGETTIANGYDIPAVSSALDFINVMTYDFHGAWEKFTGHHSPLFALPTESVNQAKLNTKYAIDYWIANGAPAHKLNLGLGSYGRGFQLDDPSQTGFYAPAQRGIHQGPYTREDGFWGYSEICDRFATDRNAGNPWTVVFDEHYRVPRAFRNNLWMGYDDPASIHEKSIWAMQNGLGGVMMWSVETDDFHGFCGGEKNPLIKAMYRAVNGEIPPPPPTTTTTAPVTTTRDPNQPTTTTEATTTTTGATTTTTTTVAPGEPGVCTASGQRLGEKCDKFYLVCTWNTNAKEWNLHRFNCSSGLSYDPTIRICDWDAIVGC